MVSGATAGSRSDYGQYEPIDPNTAVSVDGKYALDPETKKWTKRRRLDDPRKSSSGSGRQKMHHSSISKPGSPPHRPVAASHNIIHRTHAGVHKRAAPTSSHRPQQNSGAAPSHRPVAPLLSPAISSQAQTSAGASEIRFQKQKAIFAALSPRSRIRHLQDLRAESARRQLEGKPSPAELRRPAGTENGTSPPVYSGESSPNNVDPQERSDHPVKDAQPRLATKSTTHGGLMGPPPKPIKSRVPRVDETKPQSQHETIVIDDDSDDSRQSTHKRKGYGQSEESTMQLPHDWEQRPKKKIKSSTRLINGGVRAADGDGWTSELWKIANKGIAKIHAAGKSSVPSKETKEERRRKERREMKRKETAVEHLRDAHLQNFRSSDAFHQMPAQHFVPQEAMYPPSLPGYASNPASESEPAPDMLPYYAPQPGWIPTAPMMAPDPPAPQKQTSLMNGTLTDFESPAGISNNGDYMGNTGPVEYPLPTDGSDKAVLPSETDEFHGSHLNKPSPQMHNGNVGETTSSVENQLRDTYRQPPNAEQPFTAEFENQEPAAGAPFNTLPPIYHDGSQSNYVNPLDTVSPAQAAEDLRDWNQVLFPNGDDSILDQTSAEVENPQFDPSAFDFMLEPLGQVPGGGEGETFADDNTSTQAPEVESFDDMMAKYLNDDPLPPFEGNAAPESPIGIGTTQDSPEIDGNDMSSQTNLVNLPIPSDIIPNQGLDLFGAAQPPIEDMQEHGSETREELDDDTEGIRGDIEEAARRAEERSGDSQLWSGRDLPDVGLDFPRSPTPKLDNDYFPDLGSG